MEWLYKFLFGPVYAAVIDKLKARVKVAEGKFIEDQKMIAAQALELERQALLRQVEAILGGK